MYQITIERERKGWSKSELSRRSGVAVPDISRMESGKMYAYRGWRKKLGLALNVNPDILFEEVQ
jgi:ribosome-binding protein aMBF1 (putative translation factor)